MTYAQELKRTELNREAINRAIADWDLLLNSPSTDYRNPYPNSSDHSDAYAITAWSLYCAGTNNGHPIILRKTQETVAKRYVWVLQMDFGESRKVTVIDASDHKNGIGECL